MAHIAGFFPLRCVMFEVIREKEYLEYHEDNEQLNQDDSPQGLAYGHVSKAVVIQVEYAIPKTALPHGR